MIIDTHAHIYLEDFDDDIMAVIERAKNAHIRHIILPNVDSTTSYRMLRLIDKDPTFFHGAIGIHPTSIKENFKQELDHAYQLLKTHSFCAIGEIGIDLYWDKTFLNEQIIAFETQLKWAIQYKLPVIIHVRDAFNEALSSVKKLNCDALKGVFHSFSGNLEDAQSIIELEGFKLGINGVVTFKNSNLKKILKEIPLKYLLLETDAPYLSPVPFRGKRNEPQKLEYIIQKLSEIYNLPQEKVIRETYQNSLVLFKNIENSSNK